MLLYLSRFVFDPYFFLSTKIKSFDSIRERVMFLFVCSITPFPLFITCVTAAFLFLSIPHQNIKKKSKVLLHNKIIKFLIFIHSPDINIKNSLLPYWQQQHFHKIFFFVFDVYLLHTKSPFYTTTTTFKCLFYCKKKLMFLCGECVKTGKTL